MRWFILLVACLLMASTASAQEAGIEVLPGELWLGEGVDVACWFEQDPGPGVWADITEPISLQLTGFYQENEHFSRAYTPPVIGQYAIRCTNGSLESPGTGFSVSDLETEIAGCPGQAFTDQGIRIEAIAVRNDGSAVQINSSVGFSVTLDGVELELPEPPYYLNKDGYWVIETGGLEGFSPGSYSLVLSAEYQGREASHQTQLDVMEPLEFSIESVSPDGAHGGENITVTLRAAYHNSSVLAASSLSAELDGDALSIERTASGFTFVCPGLEPEPHTLEVSLGYMGLSASDSRPLYYMIQVRGEIRNADSGGVPANLRFIGEGWQNSVRTNVNGAFTTNVPAGSYTLEMSFPSRIMVTVEGLEVYQELNNFVRFDSFSSGEIDGIIVAGVFALEFSPDFARMVVKAEYDGSVLSDESRIMVYTCDDWNLDSRSCSGGWDELDFELDAMQNEVEFDVEHLSGFIIGRRGELELEASINRKDYATGQSIVLSGVVRDESDRPVHDARVSYSIPDGADGYVKTNTNGVFSASFTAPSQGGEHTLTVKAVKGLRRQDSKGLEFMVLTLKDFAIIPPLRVDASEGSAVSPEVLVINTGQDELESFRVRLSGIPEGWYQAEPGEWDSLLPDEEKSVSLTITPESPDQEIYTIGIEVSCDQASKSESFVMYVRSLREEKESEAMETNASGTEASPFDSVTLYLVGNYEAIINSLSLLASAGILFLIARRLRIRRPASRAWLMALLESVKAEVLGIPGRFPGRVVRPRVRKAGAKKRARPARPRAARVRRRAEKHIEVEL